MDQRVLVERARQGDHDAFAQLVDPALARLDAAARLILRDPELARDAVQETLIRAWRDLPGLRDPDRFDAWLHRLTVNACLDLARRRRRRPIEVELTPIDAPAHADHAGALADRELVDAALRRLDPGHRAVVALHYLLGMPLPDVAASLGIPLGTAKSRLHHALAAMRRSCRPSPTRPRRRSRRAGRMTTETRFERDLPDDPGGPLPGADSRLPRRGPRGRRPHAAAARLDLPRKVAPHGRHRQPSRDRAARPVAGDRIGAARHRPHRSPPSPSSSGSRQTKVPAPFGLAGNGLIVYALDGDIFTLDPATGLTAPLVSGPEHDLDPVFSADGTRVAFRRASSREGNPSEAIVVAAADGSNPLVVTGALNSVPGYFEWAPDSRSLIVEDPNGAAVWMLDATAPAEPRVLATDATTTLRPFRPPEGDGVLIVREVGGATRLILLDLASGEERVLVTGEPGQELGGARWSPDGTQVVYVAKPADEADSRRLFVVDVDGGTEPRQLTDGTRNEFDMDAVWSHDGSRIAFTRWEQTGATTWDVRPIMLYTVADDTLTEIGPRARDVRAAAPNEADAGASAGEGLYIEFSPDASTLLAMPSEATGHPAVVDLATGDWEVVDALVAPSVAANVWQRTALP